jgi:ornithine cyclodeaminase/alanine dehydrogenase-like protein (mu-crystallin family)
MSEALGVEVVPVTSAEDAIGDADIAMCATNTLDPIFFEHWIKPGMHVSAIKRPELDPAAVKRADRVVIHVNEGAPFHVTATDVVLPEKSGGHGWEVGSDIDFGKLPTLPDLISGTVEGRQSDAEVTCFINNLGLGFQFAAVGALIYRKAKESGTGHDLPTDWFTEDVHP